MEMVTSSSTTSEQARTLGDVIAVFVDDISKERNHIGRASRVYFY